MSRKLKLTIDLGNAAFEDKAGFEVAAWLRELAAKLEPWDELESEHRPIRDFNGNRVGEWSIDHE
jgi:hypothetical protein